MKIYELPSEIQNRIFELQTACGNEPNDDLDITAKKSEGNFDWHTSGEGFKFWRSIYRGFYKDFFDKYPKTKEAFGVNLGEGSFSEYVASEIIKDCPLYLSENSQDDLKQTIVKYLKYYQFDALSSDKNAIIESYKRRIRSKYSNLRTLVEETFPGGCFSKEPDGTLFGIEVMLKKMFVEIADLVKEIEE